MSHASFRLKVQLACYECNYLYIFNGSLNVARSKNSLEAGLILNVLIVRYVNPALGFNRSVFTHAVI